MAKYWNHYTPQFLNDKIKLTHIFQKKYAIFQSTYSCNSEMKVLFVFDSLQSHGSRVHGILQKGILEWVAFPSPGDLPNLGIELRSPGLQVDSLLSEPPGKTIYVIKAS